MFDIESENMMAIKRMNVENKFDEDRKKLESQELADKEKTKKVIQKIAGESENTKIIYDKNGRCRRVKVKEERKAFQVYLPVSVFQQLEEVLEANGKSRNSVIEELVREYVKK